MTQSSQFRDSWEKKQVSFLVGLEPHRLRCCSCFSQVATENKAKRRQLGDMEKSQNPLVIVWVLNSALNLKPVYLKLFITCASNLFVCCFTPILCWVLYHWLTDKRKTLLITLRRSDIWKSYLTNQINGELITSIKKGFTHSFLWRESLPKVWSVEFDLLNLIYTWPFQEDNLKCRVRAALPE